MKKIFLLIISLLILLCSHSFADTLSAKYFPLAVGNKWVYLNGSTSGGPFYYSTSITRITKDTVINGKKYFSINNIPFTNIINFWIRYDSTSGQLKWFNNIASCNNEDMIFDLSAIIGDSCNNSTMPCTVNNYICNYINDSLLWGINSRVKAYSYYFTSSGGPGFHTYKFAKSIGFLYLQYTYSGNYFSSTHSWLKGFVINGQVHGDTNTISLIQISGMVPDKFALYQNYPNPFNPVTNIKYQIKNNSLVNLRVYDVLGKEAVTLVNEKQSPGVYEVTWDASAYPSGVYFYTIETQSHRDTKKMLLIK
ncbi:MAG: T9SS type A sorting domain-containing protein [Ignavibacteriae bacterium]|nr:T9SS type A sorting domain-containing protein [Ignavibacteriota bacterium]